MIYIASLLPFACFFGACFNSQALLFLVLMLVSPSFVGIVVNGLCLCIVLVLNFDLVPSLGDFNNAYHRPLQPLCEQLLASFSYFTDDTSFLAKKHALLDAAFDVDLVVNSEFAVDLGNPCSDGYAQLIRKLLVKLLEDGLLHRLLSLADF